MALCPFCLDIVGPSKEPFLSAPPTATETVSPRQDNFRNHYENPDSVRPWNLAHALLWVWCMRQVNAHIPSRQRRRALIRALQESRPRERDAGDISRARSSGKHHGRGGAPRRRHHPTSRTKVALERSKVLLIFHAMHLRATTVVESSSNFTSSFLIAPSVEGKFANLEEFISLACVPTRLKRSFE